MEEMSFVKGDKAIFNYTIKIEKGVLNVIVKIIDIKPLPYRNCSFRQLLSASNEGYYHSPAQIMKLRGISPREIAKLLKFHRSGGNPYRP